MRSATNARFVWTSSPRTVPRGSPTWFPNGPRAIVCLDTFHVISWATKALDEVRRQEWNKLRQAGAAKAAKAFKGLRFLLRRNWENLTGAQRCDP
ncbi:MAG: transposase [Acidimicrobiales bacterium]